MASIETDLAQRRSLWTVPAAALDGLTPARARDLVVECFFQSQREIFLRTKQRLGAARLDEQAIRSDVTSVVRVAFAETGGDFEGPSADSLRRVVAVLARKAEAWGTPLDVIAHHRAQMLTMLERLGPSPRRSP